MLRIAIFLPSLRGGGAERVSVTLANELAARGHDVHLLVAQGGGPYASAVAANVTVIDFGRSRVIRALFPLARYLRRQSPDILLGVMSHCNAVALAAAGLSRSSAKVFVSEHNSTEVRRSSLMIRLIKRIGYRRASAVVAVSNGIRDELILGSRLDAARVVTIYNPLDIRAIESLAGAEFERPWPSDDVPFVVAAGSLQPQKDFATLIRAVAIVNKARPLRLAVLGRGPQLDELKTLARQLGIEEHVHFAGFQSNPYVWMRHASMFVLSSRWEGLPGVLLEALATGTRILSTNCPTGPNEILDGGRWGVLVEPARPAEMAEGIMRVLAAPVQVGQRERALAFRTEVSADRYEQLFRDGPAEMDPVQR